MAELLLKSFNKGRKTIGNSKPKIGFIGLSLELYEKNLPQLMDNLRKFSQEVKLILEKMAEVVYFPLACKREQIEEAFSSFKKENVNGVILVFLSYSTSFSILPALKKYSLPILIWNTQKIKEINLDFSQEDLLNNHGMHGVQDLCSVLKREKISFSLITGHFLDGKTKKKVKSWCKAAKAVSTLRKINIGRIGGTFKDMGDFSVESRVLTEGLGSQIKEIPFPSLTRILKEIEEEEIEHSIKEDRKKFLIDKSLKKETHFRSAKLELALRKLIKKENLSALAINFSAFDPSVGVETVPFLGISKLLGEGLGYGGEGDIYSATAVYLLQLLAGKANFVEMFTTDYKNNCILMNHMGESNPQMAKRSFPIRMIQDDLALSSCLPTAVLSFTLDPGEVTLLNLRVTSEKKLEFILTQGEVMNKSPLKSISSPHFIFKPWISVEEFLTQYSFHGGTHHSALCYGNLSEEIRYVSEISGVSLVEME